MGRYFCEFLLEMEKVMPVVAFWRWKGFLKRIMWHLKILISPNYTCLGHFHMEKRFFKWLWELCGLSLIRDPCGTVQFQFLHLPSFIFLYKSTCFSFLFTLFPIWSHFFLKRDILSSSLLPDCPYECSGLLICQTYFICNTKASQILHSDDVNKVSNTESVPPEWRPTPNIIFYASPFPC